MAQHTTQHASREEAAIAAKVAVLNETTRKVEVEKSNAGTWKVILITYATAEDAVRKALAAVGRDKVISGKPQVIRIEKN